MYSGIGFVTVAGLVEALTRCHLTGHTAFQVLARGAKTKYYFVRVDILRFHAAIFTSSVGITIQWYCYFTILMMYIG